MINFLRNLDDAAKWILFVGVTGGTWFMGQEEWFSEYRGLSKFERIEWEWIFITTAAVAFGMYGLLFGFNRNRR